MPEGTPCAHTPRAPHAGVLPPYRPQEVGGGAARSIRPLQLPGGSPSSERRPLGPQRGGFPVNSLSDVRGVRGEHRCPRAFQWGRGGAAWTTEREAKLWGLWISTPAWNGRFLGLAEHQALRTSAGGSALRWGKPPARAAGPGRDTWDPSRLVLMMLELCSRPAGPRPATGAPRTRDDQPSAPGIEPAW